MAGNPTMGELVSTTLRYRRKNIADAITRNNGIMFELRRRKKIELVPGGRTISTPIMYGETGSFMYYQGKEALNLADQEQLTSAEYAWKQWAVGVSISGFVQMQNSGSPALKNILRHRIMAAEKTLANRLSASAYSDGSGFAGKELHGLELLNGTSSTVTVGGIDTDTNTWYRNKVISTGGVTSATIEGNMTQLRLELTRGGDKVDLILSDNSYYRTFKESLRGDQRFMDAKLANAGFTNIKFEGIPVIADGQQGGYAPPGMHFLNCETMRLVMHTQRNNVVLDGAAKRPITEDSENVIIAGMGNMIVDNRMLNGRLVD